MVDSLVYFFIVLAIGVAIVAEILVAYQKYLMKKQFVEELNKEDAERDVGEKRQPGS